MSSEEHHPHPYPPIEVEITRVRPDEETQRFEPPASFLPQIFAAVSATLGGLVMGTCIGWSGPALHLLISNSSDPFDYTKHEFPVTEEEGSFVASFLPAGALFGGAKFVCMQICKTTLLKIFLFSVPSGLSGGFLINRFGRKGAMMGDSVIFALAYLCLAAAKNVWMLYAGKASAKRLEMITDLSPILSP